MSAVFQVVLLVFWRLRQFQRLDSFVEEQHRVAFETRKGVDASSSGEGMWMSMWPSLATATMRLKIDAGSLEKEH